MGDPERAPQGVKIALSRERREKEEVSGFKVNSGSAPRAPEKTLSINAGAKRTRAKKLTGDWMEKERLTRANVAWKTERKG